MMTTYVIEICEGCPVGNYINEEPFSEIAKETIVSIIKVLLHYEIEPDVCRDACSIIKNEDVDEQQTITKEELQLLFLKNLDCLDKDTLDEILVVLSKALGGYHCSDEICEVCGEHSICWDLVVLVP